MKNSPFFKLDLSVLILTGKQFPKNEPVLKNQKKHLLFFAKEPSINYY
jgi:hypothetical protein